MQTGVHLYSVSYLLDTYKSLRAPITTLIIAVYSVPIILMCLIINIYVFYVLAFVFGIGGAGIEIVGNVGCLEIWRGHRDASPFMHSMHFGFSLGTVIGPLMATYFLGGAYSDHHGSRHHHHVHGNATSNPDVPESHPNGAVALFVLSGLIALSTGTGYLIMTVRLFLCRRRKRAAYIALKEKPPKETAAAEEESDPVQRGPRVVLFVGIMCVFFFLYIGTEYCIGTFLSTFSIKSTLQASKVDGAYLTAIFWGSFAAFRFVTIFLAIWLDPLATMVVSLSICLSSAIGMAVSGESSLTALKVRIERWLHNVGITGASKAQL